MPVERLPALLAWLVERFRARAASLFGLPDGEDLRVSLVTGQPWSGYNWFDGGRRSRVDINTDLPVRVADLVSTVAHETYPGHHLEHAWKEADLVDRQGRLESSILLINTPECLISEGLANLGRRFVVPADEQADLVVELYDRAGLDIAADPAARDAAELDGGAGRAARRRWPPCAAMPRSCATPTAAHDDVLAYLEAVGRYAPAGAAKRLEFIEHPLWRTYVFVYAEGEACWRAGSTRSQGGDRAARFGRLLHEQLTPAAVTGLPAEDHPVVALGLVVGVGGRPVQPLRAGPIVHAEAHRPVEPDRDAVARPGNGVDPADAALRHVVEESLVEHPAEAVTPMVRARGDQVDVGPIRVVRADEADQEADERAGGVLGDPRRPREMLEPLPQEQRVEATSAPPFVDQPDQAPMIAFLRSTEADLHCHRAAIQAVTAATPNSTGTRPP